MLSRSVLKDQIMKSSLKAQSTLRPKGGKKRKTLVFSLTLTSLIDAFSILVIYLLINFGASQTVQPGKDMQLPMATQTDSMDVGTVVSINKGRYFVDDREVA